MCKLTKPVSGGLAARRIYSAAIVFMTAAVMTGCGGKQGSQASAKVITNCGSDTMVNVAQMWAEHYAAVAPDVKVEVAGGGSGVGARDLTQGMCDIANSSRHLKDTEKEQAKANTGKEPVEWVAGYDAMAIYVHKDNPVDSMTIGQLAEIFGEGGSVDKWSQVGVDLTSLGGNDEIVRVSRQNSSGTYYFFREHILNQKDFKRGSKDMSGSKDVVELVGRSLGAIGYSGMGYADDSVKFVKIVSEKDGKAYEPSVENVASGHYPLARPLLMYTLGQPEGHIKVYMDWIFSPAGQECVEKSGYIPLSMEHK